MFDWIKVQMGNLMSCVLICGAVEVVHVVHSDGHVERLIRPLDSSHKSAITTHKNATSSLPQADLMRCLSNLGRAGGESEGFPGGHYLLLPIRNADDPSAASGGVFKYKRLSSFQFYKSAFLSNTLKPKNSLSSSSSSSSSKSLVPSKVKSSTKDHNNKSHTNNNKKSHTNNNNSSNNNNNNKKNHHHSSAEDRKQLLKDSQPFKVKQEGGVTKLVVSKKYLAQLLSESNNMKTSTTSTSSSSCPEKHTHHHHQQQTSHVKQDESSGGGVKTALQSSSASSTPRVGRPGIWRPALESISEGTNNMVATAR